MNRTCTIGLLLAAAGVCFAGDWPRWGGSDECNMVSPETHLPATFEAGRKRADGSIDVADLTNVQWLAHLGSFAYATPAVVGGRVFVGTNDRYMADPRLQRDRGGVLLCFDRANGRQLWRLFCPRYRQDVHGSRFDDLNTGVCSSPTVEGDRLYVVSNRGEVLCLDVDGQADGNDGPFLDEGAYMAPPGAPPVELRGSDADILWRFDMIADVPTAPHDATNCNPLIVGELVFVATGNGVHRMPDKPNPLPEAPSLIALDKRTGRLVAVDREGIGHRVFHGQWSSPSAGVVEGRTLIFYGAGDGVVYAFQPPAADLPGGPPAALKKVWSFDCNPQEFKQDAAGAPIDYWAGDGSRTRVERTFVGPSEIIATPVFHKGRVYVATGRDPTHGRAHGILHCIDAAGKGDITATGAVWSYRDICRSMSTVSVADGLCYIADLAGVVHCLDADTGKVQWIHQTDEPIWSSTYVADGKVYVGTERGNLWVFAAGREKKILATIKLPAPLSCTPVAAGGTLYLATHRYLYAVAEPKQE